MFLALFLISFSALTFLVFVFVFVPLFFGLSSLTIVASFSFSSVVTCLLSVVRVAPAILAIMVPYVPN